METLITFTPAQLVAFIGAVCGFIASIGAAVAVIVKMITKIKQPEIEQNRRIKALEEENKVIRTEIEEIKKCRNDDNTEINGRFDRIEKAQKVTLKSLQALIDLSLGVSDTEALKKVSDDLNDYLLNK